MTDLPPPNYSDLELPSYDTSINTPTPTPAPAPAHAHAAITAPTSKSILGPATLYISGRFIYSTDPQEPPLYEFSHSIGYLHDNDRSVKVERVDTVVKTSGEAVPKNRHLFDLKHPTAAEFPTFPYHAEVASRRALGSFGVSYFRSGNPLRHTKGYRFDRAAKGADRKLEPQDVLFEACSSRSKGVGYEWRDCQGEIIAREVEDEGVSMSLVITAEMSVELRDALVAAWILRIWWDLSKGDSHTMRLMTANVARGEKLMGPRGLHLLNKVNNYGLWY